MGRKFLNQFFRFSLKLFLAIIFIVIFDRGVGLLLKHFYFQQRYGKEFQTTYVLDSTRADILIFGSSRASHHYIPEIFEKRTGETCYNAGKDGNYILYSYYVFKAVVKRYNPKLIIFDIRPYDLGNIPSEYDRLSQLLPYYQDYPELSYIIDRRSPFEKLKHISSIYSYNSLLFQEINGNLEFQKLEGSGLKGYSPLSKIMRDEKFETWDLSDILIDENKIEALSDIISTCKEKKIELLFVQSPTWMKIDNCKSNQIIMDLCSRNGIGYIDMSNDTAFINHPSYFEDINHLNNQGAGIFSEMLTSRMFQLNYKF